MSSVTNFLLALKELFFPLSCIACSCRITGAVGNVHLCPDCRQSIEHIQPPLCSCCGKEYPEYSGESHLCASCITNPPSYSKARAILRYNDALAPIIHAFKYQGKSISHATFAALKGQSLVVDDLNIPDYIVPVPLHIKRLRERGFNQAQLLANLFFSECKKKIRTDIVQRRYHTAPQTKLSGSQRRSNLQKAFRLHNTTLVQGKTFLLVDDVFTTGTTLHECARVLRSGGAKDVQALTLARVKG